LSHNIYHIFRNTKIIFEVWKALEYKYGTKEKYLKDIGLKSGLIFKWLMRKVFSSNP
jgi:hypothetical protein